MSQQTDSSTSKAGLFGLTMILAQETARKGITVNSVAPAYIATEMVAAVPEEALDKVIAKIPVGRLGDADEIARVVEFLADPDSSFNPRNILPARERRKAVVGVVGMTERRRYQLPDRNLGLDLMRVTVAAALSAGR